MFGLGIGELILIFVIFLIFFGPDKLPDLAKNLGRAMAELRRTVDELKFDMNSTEFRPAPTNKPAEPTANLEAPAPAPEAGAELASETIKTDTPAESAKSESKNQA